MCYVGTKLERWITKQAKQQGCSASTMMRYLLEAAMPNKLNRLGVTNRAYHLGYAEGYADGQAAGPEEGV